MVIARELVAKISDAFSLMTEFTLDTSCKEIEKACTTKLVELGYLVPEKEHQGYVWDSWGKDDTIFFDFLGYSNEILILGECTLYNDIVPITAVKDFITRISKVNSGGRKISAIFVSNVPLSKEGYQKLRGIEDIEVETIVYVKKK